MSGAHFRRWLRSLPLVDRAATALKARQQENYARRMQRHYEAEAARAGLTPPQGEALRTALRSRIAARRQGRQAARLGDMHVFLAYSVEDWEWILPRALAPFGEVSAFDWKSRGYNVSSPDWLERRENMNREMLEEFQAAHRRRPVDAVVGYLSGLSVAPETLRAMASAGAVIFNFSWDDTLGFPGPVQGGRYRSPAALAGAVDLNLTSTPSAIVRYAVHGGLAMFFPEAAHPEVHKPFDIPFEFDASFVGAKYGPRAGFFDRLRVLGAPVTCFGRGWEGGALSPEEMVCLYSRSRINLGLSGIGHSLKLMHLKGRDFEVPMSGGLYLTQDNPELSLVYEIGKEIITWFSPEDCARKIRELLAEPARATEIRAAGRARALRDHTYLARWRSVFETAGLLIPGSA